MYSESYTSGIRYVVVNQMAPVEDMVATLLSWNPSHDHGWLTPIMLMPEVQCYFRPIILYVSDHGYVRLALVVQVSEVTL